MMRLIDKLIVFFCFWVALISISTDALSQCVAVDFTMNPIVCLDENVILTTTDSFDQYEWDFCSGDLNQSPSASIFLNSNNYGYSHSIEIAESNGLFFGFFLSRGSRKLFRLDFGADISTQPTAIDLGGLGINLDSWRTIKIGKQGNDYFGFLIGDNSLYRISFGSDLTSIPSNAEILFTGSPISAPIDLVLVEEAGIKYLFVTNLGNDKLVRFKLQSLGDPTNLIIQDEIVVAGVSAAGGISFMKECDHWYAVVTSVATGKIFKLYFANGLDEISPLISEVNFGFAMSAPAGVALAEDNGTYYTFVQSNGAGKLYRINFGSSLGNVSPTGIDLGNFGISAAFWGFSMKKAGSSWLGFSVENSGTRISKIVFANNCFSNRQAGMSTSELLLTQNVGNFNVTLRAKNNLGTWSSKTKSIQVTSSQSPDITFTSQNICANHDINFASQNTSGNITNYNWDFGDTNTSMLQDPTHQYTAAAEYPVVLQVTASNGCNNLARDTVTIYNEPIPNFNLPTDSPICTNQEYLFTNTSTFDPGSNPAWQWEVNTTPVSTDQDLAYLISSTVQQDIKLIASIPGCANEITQSILTVEEGPQANFTFSNGCQDTSITFTNSTTGTVTAYAWDFGDGNMSMQTNASNTYTTFGPFDVTLQASNAVGCVNTSIQEITIYSIPQPDFSIDLPPFSCNGSPSQFNDLTPSPPDSNLDTWAWTFGDPQNGNSSIRNAQYSYLLSGDYNVKLEVTTNFGCTSSTQKLVTISESPSANFSFTPACVNQATTFTPISTTGIISWQWKIATATYNQQAPTHVFGSSNTFNVELTAIHNNGCVTVLSKQVSVPVPVTPNFSSTNNCSQQNTVFTDLTPSGTDPVVSRAWQFGTLGTGTGSTSLFTFPASGSYPTKLTVTNVSGCSYIISKNVNIASSPIPTFTATPLVGTVPLTVQLVNTSANIASQLWSANDPESSTSTATTTQFLFNELGQYVVDLTVTNPEGCSATSSKIISVIVPSLDLELTSLSLNPSTTGEINLLVAVKNNSNTPITNPKIAIDISGQVVVSETLNAVIQPSQTHTQVLATGIVAAKGGANYVCAEVILDGDINTLNNKLCLNQASSTVVLDPYPNPGSDQMTIEWISESQGVADIYIFDPVGRKVFDYSLPDFESGLNRIAIPLQNFNPGIYHVLYVSGGVRKSFRYIVRR